MSRVEMFYNSSQYELEKAINDFIENKKVISVSYSTTKGANIMHHYACVCYEV